jgi:hypothetical protein
VFRSCCHKSPTGDPYQITTYDHLHNWSLGVVCLAVSGIKDYADRKERPGSRHHGTKALKVLEARMRKIPRCEGLQLPSLYFVDPGRLTAKEHNAVLKVW